jgi:putative ABC transport system ATP-binding protein
MINLKNIARSFLTEGVESVILNGVNIHIEEKEFVAISGPAGCGKSILLGIIGMLDLPDAGEYFFEGSNVLKMPCTERETFRKHNIGYVFQYYNFIDELTISENVALPLQCLNIPSSLRQKKTKEAMEISGISHKMNRFPRELSELQRHLAALARAFVLRPKLILADEPSGQLDLAYVDEIMKPLTIMQDEGSTVVTATSCRYVADYAHRTIQLFEGKIYNEKQ